MKRHERDLHALANGPRRSRPGGRAAGAGPDDGNCLTALRKQRINIYPGPRKMGAGHLPNLWLRENRETIDKALAQFVTLKIFNEI
jgi:hypothetical protein